MMTNILGYYEINYWRLIILIEKFTWIKKRVKGFTLAEVLITLGIIGIVAAMTLPMLIKEYQKHVWVNQLKKSKSTIESGLRNIMADNEVTDFRDTDFYSNSQNLSFNEYRKYQETYLKKYFKILNTKNFGSACTGACSSYNITKKLNHGEGYDYWVYGYATLVSGEQFNILIKPSAMFNIKFNKNLTNIGLIGIVFIDVNGALPPNTYGRDSFVFRLSSDGRLVAQGSREYAIIMSDKTTIDEAMGSDYYWASANEQGSQGNNGCRTSDYNGSGYGCTGRVLEENAMNY